MLEASPAVERVESAASAEEALVALGDGAAIDAVFLDVRMPGLGGLELARVLRRFEQPPAVVFVSAFDDAAVDAFELAALDYLRQAGLARAARRGDRARAARRTPRRRDRDARGRRRWPSTTLRGGGTRLLARSSVLYLQAHGDYVRVASTEGRFLLRARLSDLEERWAAPRLRARAPRLRRQPAARGRGAPAAQRHRRAGDGRRRRGADRPPPGRRAAAEAGRVSAHSARRAGRGHRPRRPLPAAADPRPARPQHGGAGGVRRHHRRAAAGAAACCRACRTCSCSACRCRSSSSPGRRSRCSSPSAWLYARRAAALEESFRDLVEPRE